MTSPERALAALALEAAIGYPAWLHRWAPHPIVWVGRAIDALERAWNRPAWPSLARRVLGIATLVLIAGGAGAVGWAIDRLSQGRLWAMVLALFIAITGLAQRSLYDHVAAVSRALERGDLAGGRQAVGMIVGRDVEALDEQGVAAAALESLAESFNDGVVAPAFWLLVGGLAGLFTYKAVNTADSTIGHREPRWRAFGWASARMDDVLNLIPARLAGVLVALAGFGGWTVMIRDAHKHASPNAGWPEAAMAGALRVSLGGPVAYDGAMIQRPRFGDGPPPGASDLKRGLRLYVIACALLWALMAVGSGMAALMIQGCGSDVGKSTLVAGLCRLLTNRGLTVRPFKSQNMSNNAAVTADGGEIGRAQALQALACRTPASVDMNPVLLKPQSDVGAQLVVRGQMAGTWKAAEFQHKKASLLEVCLESFRRLEAESDLVIVEGAGSPAETNLRRGDIANMGFAAAADLPVVLTGDIDRGHVIAALVGAHAVLEEDDRTRIKGFLINKFRGDPALFEDGRAEIVQRTGWRDLGVAPWLAAARHLPAEDAVVLERGGVAGGRRAVKIVVPMLSRIANFDDFDPLQHEPSVDFAFIPPGRALPGDADLVILPGTKATLADLAMLRREGWDIDIAAHVRRGGRVLGLCGGYQMLGRRVADPLGVEGPAGEAPGLGLLDVETVLTDDKVLRPAHGRLASADAAFEGYEIHVGRTTGPDTARPFLLMDQGDPHGAVSTDGRIAGAYVHGLFRHGEARAALLSGLGVASTGVDHSILIEAALDDIAATLERTLDIAALCEIAGLPNIPRSRS